jgi:hypothetical protein
VYTLGPIGAASMLVWVGLWGLLDVYLFACNKTLSALASNALATFFVMLCHALSPCSQHVGYVSLVAAFGVCYWRGVWYLWEELVFCETLAGKSAMAMVLGVGILLATGNFQTTVVGPPILFVATTSLLK